jgi:hypothetical protein
MREKKVVGRRVATVLGIISIILAVSLTGIIANYTLIMNDKDNTISSLQNQNNQIRTWLDGNESAYQSRITDMNSTISSLNSQIVILQKQANDLLKSNATYAELAQIIAEPSAWVNKTVVVEGNLTFIVRSIENIGTGYFWNYMISSNGTFGLNWSPDQWSHPSYDGVNAIVIGVLKATTVYNYPSILTAYYIEAEKIVPL